MLFIFNTNLRPQQWFKSIPIIHLTIVSSRKLVLEALVRFIKFRIPMAITLPLKKYKRMTLISSTIYTQKSSSWKNSHTLTGTFNLSHQSIMIILRCLPIHLRGLQFQIQSPSSLMSTKTKNIFILSFNIVMVAISVMKWKEIHLNPSSLWIKPKKS